MIMMIMMNDDDDDGGGGGDDDDDGGGDDDDTNFEVSFIDHIEGILHISFSYSIRHRENIISL